MTVTTDELDHYDELENSSELSDTELLRDAGRRAGVELSQPPSARTPPKPDPKAPKPYGSFDDQDLLYRNRGKHADGARPVDTNSDAAERSSLGIQSRSLLDLHIDTGGAYRVRKESTDPDQLEVCRECKQPLDIPRDDQGFVIRAKEGQRQYCGDRHRMDRKNRKRRNRRARLRGERVMSTYSPSNGVPTVQGSSGPQERFTTGEVVPWTVPCWAADPWLKFVQSGPVPIGRGPDLSYVDPVGDTAALNVDNGVSITERKYPADLDGNNAEAVAAVLLPGIPVGKLDLGQRTYVHNVFDAVFDGMDYYRRLVLAGKPKRDRSHSEKR